MTFAASAKPGVGVTHGLRNEAVFRARDLKDCFWSACCTLPRRMVNERLRRLSQALDGLYRNE